MENAITLAVLLVAVVCVMAATRPTHTSSRRRESPRDPDDPPGPRQPHDRLRPGPDEPPARIVLPSGAFGRWERPDLARALALDLVAPGAEAEVWPAR
jgi:hypothetical protein